MELVFEDKSLPYKSGPFPKASFPIEKVWDDCSKWVDPHTPKPDTSNHDEGIIDTLNAILNEETEVILLDSNTTEP